VSSGPVEDGPRPQPLVSSRKIGEYGRDSATPNERVAQVFRQSDTIATENAERDAPSLAAPLRQPSGVSYRNRTIRRRSIVLNEPDVFVLRAYMC
jgi:hypothetical protein